MCIRDSVTSALKITKSMTRAVTVATIAAVSIVAYIHWLVPGVSAYWEKSIREIFITYSTQSGSEAPLEDFLQIVPMMSAMYAMSITAIAGLSSYMVNMFALRISEATLEDPQWDVIPDILPMLILLSVSVASWMQLDGAIQLLLVSLVPFILSGVIFSWAMLAASAAPVLFKVLYLVAFVFLINIVILLMLMIGIFRSVFRCYEQFVNLKK